MSKEATNPKEYLIKSKLYKGASIVFVILGLIVFMILYISNVEGRVLEALRNPFTLLMFVVPFLPAIVLSMVASKNEKKYLKLTGHNPE